MDSAPFRHMIVADGFVSAHGNILNDGPAISGFLRGLAERIGMNEIALHSHKVPAEIDSGPGWTMVDIITTSHISIHTFPRFSFFMLDVASCKALDHDVAFGHIVDGLHVVEWRELFTRPEGMLTCL